MGMAASQARFLALTARRSNSEYEGQQINQQRTALANQTSALFNQSLSLQVPTAPNVNDYTNSVYTFAMGDVQHTITDIQPTASSGAYPYNITCEYDTTEYTASNLNIIYGASISENPEASSNPNYPYLLSFNGGRTELKKITYTSSHIINNNESFTNSSGNTISSDSNGVISITSGTVSDKTNKTTIDNTNGLTMTDSNGNYFYFDSTSNKIIAKDKDNNDITISDQQYLNGNTFSVDSSGNITQIVDSLGNIYSLDNSTLIMTESSSNVFKANDDNSNLEYYNSSGTKIDITVPGNVSPTSDTDLLAIEKIKSTYSNSLQNDSIFYSYTYGNNTYYISESDLQYYRTLEYTQANKLQTYYTDYIDKTITETYKAYVGQDSSTGRYSTITIDDGNNGITYQLTINSIKDDDAYDQAMLNYNYAKMVYEQTIQDINNKTEILQAQDRTLELRLKQLDTEHNAIQTEIDAVQKVIQKNVETSFKTFG